MLAFGIVLREGVASQIQRTEDGDEDQEDSRDGTHRVVSSYSSVDYKILLTRCLRCLL